MSKKTVVINPDLFWITALGAAVLYTAVILAGENPVMIVLLPVALVLSTLILNSDELCLSVAIVCLPLLFSIVFSYYLLPLPGAKVNNILMMLLLIGFLLNTRLKFAGFGPAVFFYAGSVLLLTIAVIRTDHVAAYSLFHWKEIYQPFKFFLSHGLVHLLTTIPFIMIIGRIRTQIEVQKVLFYMAISLSILSVTVALIYVQKVPQDSFFHVARGIIGDNLGVHGNHLADFIIIGFPLMLSLALIPGGRYQKWFYLATVLSLMAATLIYNRSSYVTILASVPLLMILTRRYRLVLPMLLLLTVIIIYMPGVTERAATGLEYGELSIISAGRTDTIWMPVVNELRDKLTSNPLKVIFGHGRYGILDFQAFKNQQMYLTPHPHNMYIDTLVDAGLVGLLFYLVIVFYIVVRLIQAYSRRKSKGDITGIHITAGLLVAILSFLARGLSDSYLLPYKTNAYFYIVIALSFVVLWQVKSGSLREADQ